jgi:NTP pyrophosphatase (non-canonical NTP hydrolase)
MAKRLPKKQNSQAQITTFDEYQAMVARTDERKQRMVSLLGLVGEIGDLHSMIKKLVMQRDNPSFQHELREEFGDILWYLTSLASLYKIPLKEIAQSNAEKADSLYSSGKVTVFDRGYPMDEQIPRKFGVSFLEKPLKKGIQVRISINDVAIGDALTDNAHKDDGYRFHDVFHLAYAAVLGWSPVTRALLKRKRKSDEKVDEVEDGARAVIVEEAVSILVFNQAPQRGWYLDKSSIDIGLLKAIRRIVDGLEVRACTAKQWQDAIHQGYTAFEQLKKKGGGVITVDLDHQSLSYGQPPRGRRKEA